MKYYLKEYPDGVEYSPVGSEVNQAKLAAGFQIVDEIPQRIKDKEPGGKDYQEPISPQEVRINELETRLQTLEELQVKKL